MYSALDIANYIVSSNKVADLTPLKLQKLLYYVYGVYWKEKRSRLFKDDFSAWRLGPVVESVYQAYKGYGSQPINVSVSTTSKAIDKSSKDVIDPVLEVFGKISATELVTLTHLTDPWIEAFKDPLTDKIFTESIHKYFENALV